VQAQSISSSGDVNGPSRYLSPEGTRISARLLPRPSQLATICWRLSLTLLFVMLLLPANKTNRETRHCDCLPFHSSCYVTLPSTVPFWRHPARHWPPSLTSPCQALTSLSDVTSQTLFSPSDVTLPGTILPFWHHPARHWPPSLTSPCQALTLSDVTLPGTDPLWRHPARHWPPSDILFSSAHSRR
jgi:hypothetical protein